MSEQNPTIEEIVGSESFKLAAGAVANTTLQGFLRTYWWIGGMIATFVLGCLGFLGLETWNLRTSREQLQNQIGDVKAWEERRQLVESQLSAQASKADALSSRTDALQETADRHVHTLSDAMSKVDDTFMKTQSDLELFRTSTVSGNTAFMNKLKEDNEKLVNELATSLHKTQQNAQSDATAIVVARRAIEEKQKELPLLPEQLKDLSTQMQSWEQKGFSDRLKSELKQSVGKTAIREAVRAQLPEEFSEMLGVELDDNHKPRTLKPVLDAGIQGSLPGVLQATLQEKGGKATLKEALAEVLGDLSVAELQKLLDSKEKQQLLAKKK